MPQVLKKSRFNMFIMIHGLSHEQSTGVVYIWEYENYRVSDRLKLKSANLNHSKMFDVKIFFDDQNMYSNEYDELEQVLPF